MRPALTLVLAVIAAGCARDKPPRTDLEQEMFGAAAVRIHPIFTRIEDVSGRGGRPNGIEVLVEFLDQFGDPTKAAGTLTFELFEYRLDSPEPRGRRLYNPWQGSIVSLADQKLRWNRTSRTYTFHLAAEGINPTRPYVLSVRFASVGGLRLEDQLVIQPREEGRAAAP